MQWRLIVARFDREAKKKRRRSDSDGLTLAAQWVGAASSPNKPAKYPDSHATIGMR